jgi:hypothetical protein
MNLIVEDAFILVSVLVTHTSESFPEFINLLIQQYLPNLLKEPVFKQDSRFCTIAVGIIRTFYCSYGRHMHKYTEEVMAVLLHNLASKILDSHAKPVTLSAFGDIAHVTCSLFSPYIPTVMMMLQQASQMRANNNN